MYNVMKKTRENKELTQQELANIIGVSRSTYAGWENGIDTIPLSRLNDLCNYLDISLDYICKLTNDKKRDNIIKRKLNTYRIGKNLKSIRIKNGHTQSKTALLIHTNQSNYSRYERGKNIISTSLIIAFSRCYNVSIDYICGKKKNSNI